MNLKDTIRKYATLDAEYKARESAHQRLKEEQIPAAERAVEAAKIHLDMAKMSLRKADTMEAVQAGKASVKKAEEGVQDAEMLLSNLESKSLEWPRQKSMAEHERNSAWKEMWTLKKADLLERFSVPEEFIRELEAIVAADFGITGGYRKYSIGDAAKFKYGDMQFERIKEVHRQLLDEMIANVS